MEQIREMDLIRPKEATKMLGVNRNYLLLWAKAGGITVVKTLGGHNRYVRAEIEAMRKPKTVISQ
jgi:excisionase family DNA binding protein